MLAATARDLYTRTEMAAETGDLAGDLAEILHGAGLAGADPGCITGLTSAIRRLDPSAVVTYDPGTQADRRVNTGPYRTDAEFIEAVIEAAGDMTRILREATRLRESVIGLFADAGDALTGARADLAAARQRLAIALSMATGEPCTGCHGAKQAAIDEAEAVIADAGRRIADAAEAVTTCEAAGEILDDLIPALAGALTCVNRVPADLGEVYELVHVYIRNGGKLPDYARWIEGTARHGVA